MIIITIVFLIALLTYALIDAHQKISSIKFKLQEKGIIPIQLEDEDHSDG